MTGGADSGGPTPELFQFAVSHYNEKARWALDFKKVPHIRHSLLPGPHMRTVKRLSGQTLIPVLRHGEKVVAGSAAIVEYLERTFADPAKHPKLYPTNAKTRDAALAIQRRFDEEIGSPVRLAAFGSLLTNAGYAARYFTMNKRGAKYALYRAMFPGARILIRKSYQMTPENLAKGCQILEEALDYVAETSAKTGYLVGDGFTIADLTAAALLTPAVDAPETGYPKNLPGGEEHQAWFARRAEHPGAAWVREMFRKHRGSSAEIENSP